MVNDTSTLATGASTQGIVAYPVAPYLVIVFVLLVTGSFQWLAFIHSKCCRRRCSVWDREAAQSSRRKASALSLPLAAVNLYRVLAFRTTIGFRSYVFNLVELFAAVGYVTLLLVWTFIIKSNPDGEQLNWCTRAGLLAASQFPFVTVLGTRNNIVSLITRISANKLNFVHRLTARACLILIGIHVLGGNNNFMFYKRATKEPELFGIVATSVFAGLVVVSLRPVRERAYELFFYLHAVAVTVIMVATIFHINFYSTSLIYYVWPSFVVWAADRFIRTSRLIYFNLAYFSSSQRHSTLDAITELLSDSLVRVKFRRPNDFQWSPGQFAYLIMPSVSQLPFEAHPFSIANVDSILFSSDTEVAEDSGKELVFFIAVKSGFTRRLKNVAARGERVKVYIDGPYGGGVNLDCYDTSLLIAGGTGITFTLPALLSIIESARNGSSCCRRVVLVWSIRDADFLNRVSELLTKAIQFAPLELKVDLRIFLTKSHPRVSTTAPERQMNSGETRPSSLEDKKPLVDPPNSLEKSEGATFLPPLLKVASGRPDLKYILGEEISVASGKISVSVCGPDAMVKVVRNALRYPWSGPLNGRPSVTLHVERFGYA